MKNDILTDLMGTLKGMDEKLKELITKFDSTEETILSLALEINDDLEKTY